MSGTHAQSPLKGLATAAPAAKVPLSQLRPDYPMALPSRKRLACACSAWLVVPPAPMEVLLQRWPLCLWEFTVRAATLDTATITSTETAQCALLAVSPASAMEIIAIKWSASPALLAIKWEAQAPTSPVWHHLQQLLWKMVKELALSSMEWLLGWLFGEQLWLWLRVSFILCSGVHRLVSERSRESR